MDSIRRLLKSRFGKTGLPFFLLVTGSSFALAQVTDARYIVSRHNRTFGLTQEELRDLGFEKDQTSLLEEYQKLQEATKSGQLDNWENIRGPRPWEEDNQKYKDVIQKRIEEHEERKKKSKNFWAT